MKFKSIGNNQSLLVWKRDGVSIEKKIILCEGLFSAKIFHYSHLILILRNTVDWLLNTSASGAAHPGTILYVSHAPAVVEDLCWTLDHLTKVMMLSKNSTIQMTVDSRNPLNLNIKS